MKVKVQIQIRHLFKLYNNLTSIRYSNSLSKNRRNRWETISISSSKRGGSIRGPLLHPSTGQLALFDKFAVRLLAVNFHSAWLMPGQRRCSYTVKGPRHFQFSATRDDVIIECATLLAIMGRYTRPQHRRCKESGGPRERERERERVEARWRKGLVYKCAVTELVTR